MKNMIEKAIEAKFPNLSITVLIDNRKIVTLTGECNEWQNVVDVGHLVASYEEVKNVVNELTVKGQITPKKDYTQYIEDGKRIGEIADVDVLIIGAGISGCGIARELSKYNMKTMLIDMDGDVACGATKANNGDIHAGHACTPNTLKAKLNVKGNRMYTKWSEELGFELNRVGALYAVSTEEDKDIVMKVYDVAVANGVDGVRLIDQETAYELEPKLKENNVKIEYAMHLPSMGIVEPYKVAIALAENAAENGVNVLFDCTVGNILTENGEVGGAVTSKGIIKAKYIINAAGIYADEISAMANDKCYTLHNRKGIVAIIDKNLKPMYRGMSGIKSSKFVKANKDSNSKGGGMCLTPEMNILLGPSALEVADKEDTSTIKSGLDYAMNRSSYDQITYDKVIKIFAGARPADYKEDFYIEMSEITHGFINCGAIQSPGIASAPAIAEYVENILINDMKLQNIKPEIKSNYNPIRKREVEFRRMTKEEQDELIQRDPRYGRIICRCELITEGEIIDAIKSPIIPTSIDAIKRRTRAGMGRCQGGFCQARILEILTREMGKEMTEITLSNRDNPILLKDNRK